MYELLQQFMPTNHYQGDVKNRESKTNMKEKLQKYDSLGIRGIIIGCGEKVCVNESGTPLWPVMR